MTDVSLAARNISHDYRREGGQPPLHVLDDVSLDIERNSLVSLIGASGCGKSTLLKILAGLITPTSGTVVASGVEVAGPDASRGMVFQQDAVFPWLSVEDNIAYGLKCRGVRRRQRIERARRWAQLVGLGGFEEAMPKELSGGMRKRVDIARVYANEPEFLLLDEPFGALDAQTKERMQNDLLELWERDRKTIVFVTHDLDEAIHLSDYVVVMAAKPGRVREIHEVGLPRPRTAETRLSTEFLDTKRRLHGLIDPVT